MEPFPQRNGIIQMAYTVDGVEQAMRLYTARLKHRSVVSARGVRHAERHLLRCRDYHMARSRACIHRSAHDRPAASISFLLAS
jgi:ribosomal protein L19